MSDKATNGTDGSAPGASPRAGTSTQARTGAYTFKRTISEFSEDNLYGLRRGADRTTRAEREVQLDERSHPQGQEAVSDRVSAAASEHPRRKEP